MEKSVDVSADSDSLHLLTEPIMDASYLDDEINTVNDEFSSWKLLNDQEYSHHHHHNHQSNQHSSPRPYPILLNESEACTTINNSTNNNTLIDNSFNQHHNYSYQVDDDMQHGETIASMTGSILQQLEFDFDEESIHFSSHTETTNQTTTTSETSSNCSSNNQKLLFPTPLTTSITKMDLAQSNFSTDSLDKSTLLSKLNAINLENYTIAFQSTIIENNYKSILTQSCPSVKKPIWSSSKSASSKAYKNQQQKTHKEIQTSSVTNPILICYPNYVLPDLKFLNDDKSKFVLYPKKHRNAVNSKNRPMSCGDVEMLKKQDFSHVKDFESLKILLPLEYQDVLLKTNKPFEDREKEDNSEKEIDENFCQNNVKKTSEESAEEGKVIFRNKKRLIPQDPHKRFSINEKKKLNKFKRFSLQEIQEITEITKDINDTLRNYEEEEEGTQNQTQSEEDTDTVAYNTVHYNTPNNKSLAELMRSNSFMDSKLALTSAVTDSINKLTVLKSTHKTIYSKSTHGKMVLDSLCPALYSLLSDGLTPFIETIFGRVPNTVWRVVEASIHSGPTAQTLNELVLRINSEDLMVEGPVKFNAFICGLLNLRTLTSWLTFLRTKDRLLRTHYDQTGFLYSCNTSTRTLYDQMLVNSLPLSKISYTLDIFYEIKILHSNLNTKQKSSKHYANESYKRSQMKRSFSDERPKKKKSSGGTLYHHQGGLNLPKSKTQNNIYLDEKDEKKDERNKFKKLQLQWEMMSVDNTEEKILKKVTSPTACVGSKIPRPISAMVNQNNSGGMVANARPSSAFFRK